MIPSSNHKTTIIAIVLVFVSLAVISTLPVHANTPPPWTVSLDSQSVSPTDANPQPSASTAKTFRVGAILNASATGGICGSTCLQNVFAWQFGIVYDNTSVVPQGDPSTGLPTSCSSYPDCAENVVVFGAQTGTGNPNWAAQVGITHAFGGSKLVDPKIDNHHNEIEVFWTFITPNGPASVFPTICSTPVACALPNAVFGNQLASVSFGLISEPLAPISFTVRDVKFIDQSANVIPNVSTGSSAAVTVTNNPPVASFTASSLPSGDPSCVPITGLNCSAFAVRFDGSASSDIEDVTIANPSGFFWDFGDSSQDLGVQGAVSIHDYGLAGSFNITLRVADSSGATGGSRDGLGAVISNVQPSHTCSTVDSSNGQLTPCRAPTVAPNPIISISCSSSGRTAGKPFACNATVSSGTPPYASFSWSLPAACSGSSSTSSITVMCSVKGSYTVSGTVTDSAGKSASATATFTVAAQPLVASVQCPTAGLTVGKPFTCIVSATGGTAPYAGTGPQSVLESTKGTFTLTFSVKDSNFKNAVGSATVVVAPQPLVVSVNCPSIGLTVGKPFNCQVSATGGTAPYTGTGTFSRTEPTKGTKTESFTVTDANGVSASGSATVSIAAQPLVVTVSCPGNATAGVAFNCTVSAVGGSAPYSGTGIFSVTEPVKGSFSESFAVVDANGASGSGSAQVLVSPQPVSASFVVSGNLESGKTVNFDASVSGGTSPYSFSWNFGDSTAGSGPSVSHVYSAPGAYSVTLVVTDANGASATAAQQVNIQQLIARFTESATTVPTFTPINFDASTSSSTGIITSYSWDFGDSNTGLGVTISHSYSAAGNYTVTLVVRDNHALVSSANALKIIIDRAPTAAFTFSPTSPLAGQSVSFDASSSSDSDGFISNYLWNFGDSTTGSGVSTSHVYTSPGSYAILLTVTDNSGSTGTASAIIIVISPAGAHAALTHWSAKPFVQHESLSRNPTDTFLAYAVNDGNKTVWVYAKFHVVLDTGASADVYTAEIQLAPGQTVNGKSNLDFSAVFTPPSTGSYSVTATLYYSASVLAPPIGDPSFNPDVTSAKTFSFSVAP